ncbi:unnamed protein product [Rhizophagus irregularis]|nr:unnamed protein product [Rhizophagus irregularis]
MFANISSSLFLESSGRVRFRQFLQIFMDMNFGKVGNPVLPRCITLQILGSFWVAKQLIALDLQRPYKKYVYGKDTFCIHFLSVQIFLFFCKLGSDSFLFVGCFSFVASESSFFCRSDILEFSFFFCRNADLW